jgi:transcriptional regulator with XRE-family HTH domain
MRAGKLLEKLLESNGLNQAYLSAASRISKSTISAIINGKRPLSSQHLSKIRKTGLFDQRSLLIIAQHAAVERGWPPYDSMPAPLEGYEAALESAKRLVKEEGNTGAAIALTLMIEELKGFYSFYPHEREKIDCLRGRMLVEQLWAMTMTSRERIKEVQPDLEKLAYLQQALQDYPHYYEMARVLPGHVTYVAGRYSDCLSLLQPLIKDLKTSYAKAITARVIFSSTIAIASKLNPDLVDIDEPFQDAKAALEELSDDPLLNEEGQTIVHVTLCRGYLDVGNLKEARNALSKAKAAFNNAFLLEQSYQITEAQIVLLDFLILTRTPSTKPRVIMTKAVECLYHHENRFARYEEVVISELLRHGNKQVREFGDLLTLKLE